MMARSKLKATPEIAAAMAAREMARVEREAQQKAESARLAEAHDRRQAARADVRDGLARQADDARARGEVVATTRDGAVHVLSRDGLLWLIRKGRLNASQRAAADWFRARWSIVHLGGVGSCLAGSLGGSCEDMTAEKVEAARMLRDVRRGAFMNDEGLIAVVDGVCGRGDTLRDLSGRNQDVAALLEAELGVALRLLARFIETQRLTNYLKS